MIYDTLDNLGKYLCVHPYFKTVGEFMEKNDINSLALGKHEVGENGVFVLKNEFTTKEVSECFIESHIKYIDIHIILEGREKIGVCNIRDCKEHPYDPEKDCRKLTGEAGMINLIPGIFAVFYPQDGHMCQIKYGDFPEKVKKIVFKIPLEDKSFE
jgi:YhcH/YjgK/YiaL family protein